MAAIDIGGQAGEESRPQVRRTGATRPIDPPRNWLQIVNQSQNEPELAALRRAVQRNSSFGSPNWTTRAAAQLSLQRTLRPLGRPKKTTTS